MKSKFTLTIATLLTAFCASAQVWVSDSVTMGPGYGNDVFYSFGNGVSKTEPNNNWDLAFQIIPQGGPSSNVAIFANHVQDTVSVYSLHLQASSNFATLTPSDTIGRTGRPLYNSDTTWALGAFNMMAGSSPFDFSWGTYDMTTHHVNGDSLYLIKLNQAAYKVWVQKYSSTPVDSIYYLFRIAKMDGTGDTTIKIYRKNGFTDRVFAYYNAKTRSILDREPSRSAWDVVFTRYIEYISMGGPAPVPYPVMGVLSNVGVSVAEARNVDPDTATMAGRTFSPYINIIGSDWKSFTPPAGPWAVDPQATYFIKTATSTYYQLQFTGFTGSGSGKSIFRKRQLSVAVSVGSVSNIEAFHMGPNPAGNRTQIMIDARETADAQVIVSDISGRLVQRLPISIRKGLNGFELSTANFTAGTYLVTITNGNWKLTNKLIVQH